MVNQEGPEKTDGEREAAQRLSVQRRQDHPPLQWIVTADRLRANAPHLHMLQEHHGHDMVGVTAGDQASLGAHVAAAEHAGRVTSEARDDPETGLRHRFRLVRAGPLHASQADLRVNCLACWEWDQTKDTVQPCSWVTARRVKTGTVSQLMRGGRARWRIAHEPCHTLQNPGDHVEHQSGQGYHQLSGVFAVRMRLAFFVDQVQQRCCPLCQAV